MTKELQVHKQTRLQQTLAYLAMSVFAFSSLALVGRAEAKPEPQFVGPSVTDQVASLQGQAAIAAAQANPVDLPDPREEFSVGLRVAHQRAADIDAAAARLAAARKKAQEGNRGGGRTPRYGQSANGGLACIAGKESGGNYSAVSPSGKYHGKYQYSHSTWNGYGGYDNADQAPPDVQERRAQEDWNRGGGQIRSNWPHTSRGCY